MEKKKKRTEDYSKMITKNKVKRNIKVILEMIEDKTFPARRNISDYLELIIAELKPEWKEEFGKYISNFYLKKDII